MNLQILKTRQYIISQIRQFFVDNNFLEVDLPILQTSVPAEPNIYPFVTKWQYLNNKQLFLSTSPESGLKQLISQGLTDCFTLHHCFRDLEAKGDQHQPEFLMLEWYRLNSDYHQIIEDTQNLLRYITLRLDNKYDIRNNILLNTPYQTVSFTELYKKYVPNFSTLPDNEPDINQLFLNFIEPHLTPDQPLFIIDYPSLLSPLAKNEGSLSQRFEFYIGPTEIANGCTENTAPDISVPWHNLPPSAGCGLGVDRLVMALTNTNSISDVAPLHL